MSKLARLHAELANHVGVDSRFSSFAEVDQFGTVIEIALGRGRKLR